ncbi:MAG: hypothetical protein AB7U82_34895 [Blastocatellales bacterium]
MNQETPFLAMIRRANQNAIAAGIRAEEAARRRRRAPILPAGPIGAVVAEETPVVTTLLCIVAGVMRLRTRRPADRRRVAPSPIRGRSRRKPP